MALKLQQMNGGKLPLVTTVCMSNDRGAFINSLMLRHTQIWMSFLYALFYNKLFDKQ